MRRGDILLAALPGDYGKPRPFVIIQADPFNEVHPSMVVCPLTDDLQDSPLFRITLEPSTQNGLQKLSQVMVYKPHTLRRGRCGKVIGRLGDEQILRLNRSLMVFLGLA